MVLVTEVFPWPKPAHRFLCLHGKNLNRFQVPLASAPKLSTFTQADEAQAGSQSDPQVPDAR